MKASPVAWTGLGREPAGKRRGGDQQGQRGEPRRDAVDGTRPRATVRGVPQLLGHLLQHGVPAYGLDLDGDRAIEQHRSGNDRTPGTDKRFIGSLLLYSADFTSKP